MPDESSILARRCISFSRVCSDSATGIHYGIATCEGCKVGCTERLRSSDFDLPRDFSNVVFYERRSIGVISTAHVSLT